MRDAIVSWNSTIIDGHNRYEICKKHNIEFQTFEKKFEDILDAKLLGIFQKTKHQSEI